MLYFGMKRTAVIGA